MKSSTKNAPGKPFGYRGATLQKTRRGRWAVKGLFFYPCGGSSFADVEPGNFSSEAKAKAFIDEHYDSIQNGVWRFEKPEAA